jgi:outer membrane protein
VGHAPSFLTATVTIPRALNRDALGLLPWVGQIRTALAEFLFLAATLLTVAPLLGQSPAPHVNQTAPDTSGPVFGLQDVLRIAHQNNPTYLQAVDSARAAGAVVRTAYGQLLPQLSASLLGLYGQGGESPVSGGFLGASSNYLESQYQLGLNYTVNASTILTPAYGRAQQRAAEADVLGQSETLDATVAQQYVTVLEAQAKAALQDSLLADVQAQLDLTRARVEAGSATPLDSAKAAVTLGQQQVQALQARDSVEIYKLRLFQTLGVPQPAGVRLVDESPIALPSFTLDSVLALARKTNPQVNALRARTHAAGVGVTRALGLYMPTMQVTTGLSGYTYQLTSPSVLVAGDNSALFQQYSSCATLDTIGRAAGLPARNCGPSALTASEIASIRSQNQQFPFSFYNNPRQVQALITLPLFDGFTREQRIEQAKVDRSTARYGERARDLQLTADVTAAYLTLTTAVRTVDIQQQNASEAREALALAEERYRVGASTIIDVLDARAAFERADDDRISAEYDYHKAFAALESAVGHSLRQ